MISLSGKIIIHAYAVLISLKQKQHNLYVGVDEKTPLTY